MDLFENIPQPMYKYRVWDEPCSEHQFQKKVLTNSELYFASADQFNDPFDTSLPFKYKTEDLTPANIFYKLLETGRQRWPDISDEELHIRCYDQQKTGRFEDDTYWKEEYPKFKDDNNKTFGILALTAKRDNLLMWSHYSDSHRGFCVGFDQSSLIALIGGSFGNMIYQKEFPKVSLFEPKVNQLLHILLSKSLDWEYEAECRILKIGAARTIVKFSEESVLEVILGCKMEESVKQTVFTLTRAKFPNAKIFQSVMSINEFKLDIIPIL